MKPEIFQQLIEQSPAPALVTDKDDFVIYQNSAAKELLGEIPAKAAFASLQLHEELDDFIHASRAIKLALDKGAVLGQLRDRSGNRIMVSILQNSSSPERNIYYLRDITGQLNYIVKVNQQMVTENLLSRSSLMSTGHFEEALREIAQHSAQTMEVTRVNIWQIADGFSSIHSLVNYDSARGGFLENMVLHKHDFPKYFGLMQSEEIIPTTDALNDPKTEEIRDKYIVPFGIRSLLDVPVRIEGKMAGVICFEDTKSTREWHVSEQNFAVAIAQIVAQTMETNRRRKINLELEQTLSEKKLLLDEVNHRVKNNFSIVADLVSLQEQKAKDEFHRELFAGIRTRIHSMAMIHRQLYMSQSIGAVNFRDFLLDLTTHFRSTFANEKIEFTTMLDNCTLPIGKAILGALIVNELLTNSCRYAFARGKGGAVKLKLNVIGKKINLSVSDNGTPGTSDDGLGSDLVKELINKLQATSQRIINSGTETVISFSA